MFLCNFYIICSFFRRGCEAEVVNPFPQKYILVSLVRTVNVWYILNTFSIEWPKTNWLYEEKAVYQNNCEPHFCRPTTTPNFARFIHLIRWGTVFSVKLESYTLVWTYSSNQIIKFKMPMWSKTLFFCSSVSHAIPHIVNKKKRGHCARTVYKRSMWCENYRSL